jgi:hypothetical protein
MPSRYPISVANKFPYKRGLRGAQCERNYNGQEMYSEDPYIVFKNI